MLTNISYYVEKELDIRIHHILLRYLHIQFVHMYICNNVITLHNM